MFGKEIQPRWRTRIKEIPNEVDELIIPNKVKRDLSQDEEWCEVRVNGDRRRLRLHDYDKIYEIPGLYERLFYRQLKCCSPYRVTRLLTDILRDYETNTADLRVLDIGAGNGMVGDELQHLGVRHIVGIDIFAEARMATRRDRPDIYADYLVADLTQLKESEQERLRSHNLNCLTVVAALGFADIPPAAFANAFDFIAKGGWMAFNVKEDFLYGGDTSGFSRLISDFQKSHTIRIESYRRYRHRMSILGKPLHYVAVVARKLKERS